MRPIKVYVKTYKANDLKAMNVINRVKAYAYCFGLNLEVIEKAQRFPFRMDFDMEGLSPADIKKYSSICSQVSAIIHFSSQLWDLTLQANRPEDGLTEVQKAKKKLRIEKTGSHDFFQSVLNHYDQVWYLKNILEKEEYEADERINWELNTRELRALKNLIPKIRDKVTLSGVEWNEEVAVSSFDALLTASILYPYRHDFKKQFSLTIFDADFLKIYRYVRPKFKPAGQGKQFNDLDSRIDKFFAEHSKG